MVINIDPNVVYGILVAIVLIVLIMTSPSIIRARRKTDHAYLEEGTQEESAEEVTITQSWPKRDEPLDRDVP